MSAGSALTDSSSLLNTWYHLTAVLSETTGRIYVNGVQTAQNNSMLSPTSEAKTWCQIGADGGNNPNTAIDELKLYNRALSQSEIFADYNTNGPIV
jgi:hypothetical protein